MRHYVWLIVFTTLAIIAFQQALAGNRMLILLTVLWAGMAYRAYKQIKNLKAQQDE